MADITTVSLENLKSLCTEKTLIRRNYFSRTYRAAFQIDDDYDTRDITVISLPFDAECEYETMQRFHLGEEDKESLYKSFSQTLKRCLTVSKWIQSWDNEIANRFVKVIGVVEDIKSSREYTAYIITDILQPFIGSGLIGKKTSVKNICYAGLSLLNSLYLTNGTKLVINSFIPELLFYPVSDTNSGQSRIPKIFPLYSGIEGEFILDEKTSPLYLKPRVRKKELPLSQLSDTVMILNLTWALLFGKTSGPVKISTEPPKEIPKQLVEEMMKAYDLPTAAQAQTLLMHAFQDVITKTSNGEIEDVPVYLKEARNYHNEFMSKKKPNQVQGSLMPDYTELVFESDLKFIDV